MIGLFLSASKLMACTIQDSSQRLQPIHFCSSNKTPPPLRRASAPEGHTSAQCGSLQAWHIAATNLPDSPPLVLTWIELFLMEWFLRFTIEHMSIHVKQPRHLFIWSALTTFANYFSFPFISNTYVVEVIQRVVKIIKLPFLETFLSYLDINYYFSFFLILIWIFSCT